MGKFSIRKTLALMLSIAEKEKLLKAIERAKAALTSDETLTDEEVRILIRNDLGNVLEEILKKHEGRATPPAKKRYLS